MSKSKDIYASILKRSKSCGNHKRITHNKVVYKRIATFLRRIRKKKEILLTDIGHYGIVGLLDCLTYIRNIYRNKKQIKNAPHNELCKIYPPVHKDMWTDGNCKTLFRTRKRI